jgi:hypothetical protein
MYVNMINTQNIKNIKQIMRKRKKWLSLDKNTNFRNMFDTIKYLESLPIIKYTSKNNHNHNHKKLTRKIS